MPQAFAEIDGGRVAQQLPGQANIGQRFGVPGFDVAPDKVNTLLVPF
jgi:hypothetical protein